MVGFILLATFCAGCDTPTTQPSDATVLIRIDHQTVTKGQFERAFEAAKIAYSDNRGVDPELMQQARLQMLNQMTEELIVKRRAEDLGIVLDEAELEAAIRDIQKDYQDDEFEQMLLESAIPYSLWKDRLRIRLLMEKVINHDLSETVTITAKDIEDYYKAHESEFSVDREAPPPMDVKHRIVQQLRREKVETAYPQWMDDLRNRYPVTINWELWGASIAPGTKAADQAGE